MIQILYQRLTFQHTVSVPSSRGQGTGATTGILSPLMREGNRAKGEAQERGNRPSRDEKPLLLGQSVEVPRAPGSRGLDLWVGS